MTESFDPYAARRAELELLPTAVYRYFDGSDLLIYVGMSHDPVKRRVEHAREWRWFERITREHVTWYCDRPRARGAELRAILTESPLTNGNWTPELLSELLPDDDNLDRYYRGRLSRKRAAELERILKERRAQTRRRTAYARMLPSTSCWVKEEDRGPASESVAREAIVTWLHAQADLYGAYGPKVVDSIRLLKRLANDVANGLEAA